jgi:hypothetical protein
MVRQRKEPLRDLVLSEKYRMQLWKALTIFHEFILHHALAWTPALARRPSYVDKILCRIIEHMFDNQLPIHIATNVVLAVQRKYHLRHRLQRAWDSIRAWQQQRPGQHRRPISWSILQAVCLVLLGLAGLGDVRARNNLFGCVVFLLVGFNGLLRPGELFMLKVGDVGLPDNFLVGGDQVAVLVIRKPKTRVAYAREQFALVDDAAALLWLSWWIDGRATTELVPPPSCD